VDEIKFLEWTVADHLDTRSLSVYGTIRTNMQ
jgi:hypothetical protein